MRVNLCDACGKQEEPEERFKGYSGWKGPNFELCAACGKEFEAYTSTFRPEIEAVITALEKVRGDLWDAWLKAKKKGGDKA